MHLTLNPSPNFSRAKKGEGLCCGGTGLIPALLLLTADCVSHDGDGSALIIPNCQEEVLIGFEMF
jgi:hypothetical protein